MIHDVQDVGTTSQILVPNYAILRPDMLYRLSNGSHTTNYKKHYKKLKRFNPSNRRDLSIISHLSKNNSLKASFSATSSHPSGGLNHSQFRNTILFYLRILKHYKTPPFPS